MFCAWGSSRDGTETQEGVPLKTARGLGEETRWRATSWARRSGGARVGMELTHGELPAVSGLDWHSRPLGCASPVTGAPRRRASSSLVGLPCRGTALGAEVGVR